MGIISMALMWQVLAFLLFQIGRRWSETMMHGWGIVGLTFESVTRLFAATYPF